MIKGLEIATGFNSEAEGRTVKAQESLVGFCARVVPELSEKDMNQLERFISNLRTTLPASRTELKRQLGMLNGVLRTYGLLVQNTKTGFAGYLYIKTSGRVGLRIGGGDDFKAGGFVKNNIRLVPNPESEAVLVPMVDQNIPP